MKNALLAVIACASFLLSTLSVASGPGQGSVIIRIDDSTGSGHCIGASDKLTATLRRIILEKKSSMLGLIQDADLAVTLTTTLSGSSSGQNQSASFAKVVDEPVSDFGTGQISLPQEQSLLSQFLLTNGNNVFSTVDLEVGIVRTHGESVGAQVLLGAVGATKDLALPVDPFTTSFGVASAYVNSVVQPLLTQAASKKEATSSHITMVIDAANCSGDDERTGTKAIIDAADDASQPGYVDINQIDNYCFQAVLKPVFQLKFTRNPDSGDCSKVTGYTDIKNSYMAFYVNSVAPETPRLSNGSTPNLPPPLEGTSTSRAALFLTMRNQGVPTVTADQFSKALFSSASDEKVAKTFQLKSETVTGYRDALKRCDANGVSISKCF